MRARSGGRLAGVVLLLWLSAPAAAGPPCPGDADDDGRVTISELLGLVRAALAACDGTCAGAPAVRIETVVAAVQRALGDCRAHRRPLWWKGNLHTHSLWSDGDHYPEMIISWYRDAGYHFLALSDHNELGIGERWIDVMRSVGGLAAYEEYLARFGPEHVRSRWQDGVLSARLMPVDESRALFETPERFLLLPAAEITVDLLPPGGWFPAHLNATNLAAPIGPPSGATVREILQRGIDAVLAQRAATGQPMFPHVPHPNYGWSVTAEDLADLRGERFFEVFNGHPSVGNLGDVAHPSVEVLWDRALTRRLSRGDPPLFGLAVDDAHHYRSAHRAAARPGRGWVMVRATQLDARRLITAMEAGDFYASTGVELTHLRTTPDHLALRVRAEPGVRYVTLFIGTRCAPQPPPPACAAPPEAVGTVLASVEGAAAQYRVQGDELYVRATVVSSKRRRDGDSPADVETAWVQPVVARRRSPGALRRDQAVARARSGNPLGESLAR